LYSLKQGYIELFGAKNSDIAMARAKRRYGLSVLNYTVTSNQLQGAAQMINLGASLLTRSS
jgi:hypothetical protein